MSTPNEVLQTVFKCPELPDISIITKPLFRRERVKDINNQVEELLAAPHSDQTESAILIAANIAVSADLTVSKAVLARFASERDETAGQGDSSDLMLLGSILVSSPPQLAKLVAAFPHVFRKTKEAA
jgi:hypothetical protein